MLNIKRKYSRLAERVRRLSDKHGEQISVCFLVMLMLFPFDYMTLRAQTVGRAPASTLLVAAQQQTDPSKTRRRRPPVTQPDSTASDSAVFLDADVLLREPLGQPEEETDSIQTVVTADDYPYGLDGKKIFNPDPMRAVWLSALFPGLGQIYNRRYWKLPVVIGGFMGLGYATSWNNGQYQDYMQAYRDLIDNDPGTKSYMDFFPPTTNESDLDKNWLTNTMKTRKDFYRRNRDLCIICLVVMYLVCMVDAYVDASLAHFDISPGLSMDVAPALINAPSRRPALGLNWAFNF